MLLVKLISKRRNYFSIGKDYTNSTSVVVHSDTLFSAICNNLRLIYGRSVLEDFLAAISESSAVNKTPFRISSCFHYVDVYRENELVNTLYFLPKPSIRLPFDPVSQQNLNESSKLFKKIEFVSFEIVKKLQQNKEISFSRYHILDKKYLLDDKDLKDLGLEKFLKPSDESFPSDYKAINKQISIFEILTEQKVSISRLRKESQPYLWQKMRFRKSRYYIKDDGKRIYYELIPSFYFLFDCSGLEDHYLEKITAALRLIADQGLGGKRSLGSGLVDKVEFIEIDANFPHDTLFEQKKDGLLINISLVFPTIEDMEKILYFRLFGRSGYIYSPESSSIRFNDLKFVEEGSIFDEEVPGKLVQVASEKFKSENHEVYKNGIGFYVNIGSIEG